jgi:hypothetical protein
MPGSTRSSGIGYQGRMRPLAPQRAAFASVTRFLLIPCLLAAIPTGVRADPPDAPFPAEPPARSKALSEDRFARDERNAARDGVIIAAPPTVRSLRLAILPDRTSGRDWGLPYLKAAVADLNRIRPDAVFGIGDMVQGYTRSPERYDRETETFLEIVSDLTPDFYPTAGNHDVIPGTRDPSDRRFVERYRQTFGPVRYAVEFELATVVVLFTDAGNGDGSPRIDDAQETWLDATLARAAARERPILVLLHRPLWRATSAKWDERIQPMLERHGVDAVIAGHFHAMQRDPDVGGVAYHILGTCGGMIDQHPYGGQWQHLTFVDVDERGAVSIYHQPVGVTASDGFIRTEDQERTYRLKGEAAVIAVLDATGEPGRGAVDGSVRIRCTNPLDVPVEFTMSAVTAPPGHERVEGMPIVTDVRRDAFNPFVTDVATPFRLEPPAPFTLSPGESAERTIAVRCPRTPSSPPPPEIAITARFTDSQGRVVPVWISRRIPIAREIPLADARGPVFPIPAGRGFPIASWIPSPYDTLEPHATVAIGLDDDRLRIDLEVPDRHRPDDRVTPPPGSRRVTDPTHDAIRILLPDGPDGERELLFEPFTPGRGTLMAVGADGSLRPIPDAEIDAFAVEDATWRLAVRLPERFRPAPGHRINIGVADNDWTYHTQWRWLAPEAFPARFVAPEPAVPPAP